MDEADAALARLWAEHGVGLLRLAFQLTHDAAAAEDVVQDALIAMYRSWTRRGRLPESLAGYARRAVVNQFLQTSRRRWTSEIVTDTVPERDPSGFEDGLVSRVAIWHALGRLTARQRAVLVLRHYEALSDAEIASLLRLRESSVRSIASRAAALLRSSGLVEMEQR